MADFTPVGPAMDAVQAGKDADFLSGLLAVAPLPAAALKGAGKAVGKAVPEWLKTSPKLTKLTEQEGMIARGTHVPPTMGVTTKRPEQAKVYHASPEMDSKVQSFTDEFGDPLTGDQIEVAKEFAYRRNRAFESLDSKFGKSKLDGFGEKTGDPNKLYSTVLAATGEGAEDYMRITPLSNVAKEGDTLLPEVGLLQNYDQYRDADHPLEFFSDNDVWFFDPEDGGIQINGAKSDLDRWVALTDNEGFIYGIVPNERDEIEDLVGVGYEYYQRDKLGGIGMHESSMKQKLTNEGFDPFSSFAGNNRSTTGGHKELHGRMVSTSRDPLMSANSFTRQWDEPFV
ncbi:MAG TPA: hypothetical protein V6D20_07920, partial [Candidatus Obscuribacterales bacterium]